MSRLIALAIVFVCLPACATLSRGNAESEALPPLAELSCCWISQEQVTIEHGKNTYQIQTAIERSEKQITVVIFDPFGQNLAVITHSDTGVVATSTLSPKWNERMSEYILQSIYLHYLTPQQWNRQNSTLRVEVENHCRTLMNNGKAQIRLSYPNENEPTEQQARTLAFIGKALNITVTTLAHTPL